MNWDHHNWQDTQCTILSDNDLILGMIAAYRRDACYANHAEVISGHLSTDECRMFRYPSGKWIDMSDHFNMRWFKEWCEVHRPRVLKRLYDLKVFW